MMFFEVFSILREKNIFLKDVYNNNLILGREKDLKVKVNEYLCI